MRADVRRNAFLLAGSFVCNSGAFQLAAALSSLTLVAVTGVRGILGLGPAIFLAAGAIAVGPAGRLMDRTGRMPVIRGGFVLGGIGCGTVAGGCAAESAFLVCLGLALVGAAASIVLLARAAAARDVLPAGLGRKGYEVELLAVYRTEPAPADPDALARLRARGVDAITFTSSSTVDNFCDAVGAPLPDPQPSVVSIGPVTSETARARGLCVDVEADPHTIDGLVEALVRKLGQ